MAARTRRLTRSGRGGSALVLAGWLVVLALIAATPGCSRTQPATRARSARIVSLVPAVTEMLFAIGAGAQVVGVSSYDHFPPQVEQLPRVGALLDPDTERILALRPDLVVVYGSQTDAEARFKRAGIQVFVYRHPVEMAITGTMDIITRLGALTDHAAQARDLVTRVESSLAAVRTRVADRDRPRTLLVIGRQPGTLQGIYASGGVGFLHEILDIAGGENVFDDMKRESAQPSIETLLTRAPDAILELHAASAAGDYAANDLGAWSKLASVPAVRENRVREVIGDFVVVAGPRLAEGAEAIARALHPDAFQ